MWILCGEAHAYGKGKKLSLEIFPTSTESRNVNPFNLLEYQTF
jgi:hypothetical protein